MQAFLLQCCLGECRQVRLPSCILDQAECHIPFRFIADSLSKADHRPSNRRHISQRKGCEARFLVTYGRESSDAEERSAYRAPKSCMYSRVRRKEIEDLPVVKMLRLWHNAGLDKMLAHRAKYLRTSYHPHSRSGLLEYPWKPSRIPQRCRPRKLA